MRFFHIGLVLCIAAFAVNGCGGNGLETVPTKGDSPIADSELNGVRSLDERLVRYTEERAPCLHYSPLRQPLFGDVHVHTSYSFDAAANTIGATPEDAHRFAKGEPIAFWPLDESGNPVGELSIDRPLDFLAVTDHGEFLGERALCRTAGSARYDSPFCTAFREGERQGMTMLGQAIAAEAPVRIEAVCGADGALCPAAARQPWQRIIAAAETAYDRSEQCAFTSFVGYEYTGTPGLSNYHRNVLFRNANVPDLPVSYFDAPVDSHLWRELDAACRMADGCDYLTIPHNSNLANGRMAPYMGMEATLANRKEYASTRLKREPIIEIFQHKGSSECVNGLSTVIGAADELCDIEAIRVLGRFEPTNVELVDGQLVPGGSLIETLECGEGEVGGQGMVGAGCIDETDFVRSGLLVGLREEQELGLNPVKLGVVAATDTHVATAGAVNERDYRGAVTGEASPLERLQRGLIPTGPKGNPGGLAGVWAVENSRDAIFEAMQRREVFGTSGPRIAPRFFGGWSYADDLCDSESLVQEGYAKGVPMGGDLGSAPAAHARPRFIAFAARDAAQRAAPLQRLQLIKGWIDGAGRMHSEVRDISGSGAAGGQDILCAVVRDETFDAGQSAYYYLRVAEVPTKRWSTYDCQRIDPTRRPPACDDGTLPQDTVEMAWTSPIWYRPPVDRSSGRRGPGANDDGAANGE